jgi:hypothetical protein
MSGRPVPREVEPAGATQGLPDVGPVCLVVLAEQLPVLGEAEREGVQVPRGPEAGCEQDGMQPFQGEMVGAGGLETDPDFVVDVVPAGHVGGLVFDEGVGGAVVEAAHHLFDEAPLRRRAQGVDGAMIPFLLAAALSVLGDLRPFTSGRVSPADGTFGRCWSHAGAGPYQQ